MQQVVGGEVVAAMLADEGVDTVFGIVDGTYLGLFSSFEKYGITLRSPRHETTAAHMAGAYARATGRLGVCMASNGPGVANVLPGVAVEQGEGNRVLLLTSSRRQAIVEPDRGGTYQYFDQCAVVRPMSKWSGHAASVERVPELFRKALRAAWHGRPGVVHLDVPEDVLNGTFEVEEGWRRPPSSYRYTGAVVPDPGLVDQVAELLARAERPVLHVGSGAVHARAEAAVVALAELLQAPVTTSWGAQAAVPVGHPLGVPLSALEVATTARTDADLFLVLGSRVGETDWWGRGRRWGGPAKTVVQVDADDEVLGLNKPVDVAVLGDVGVFVEQVTGALGRHPVAPALLEARGRWATSLEARTKELRAELDVALLDEGSPLHPALVPHVARQVFGEDALLVVDGGNTAVWTTMYDAHTQPGSVFSTFKFGMLGAGLGQALGAKAARPDRSVYCVLGDGAMGMHVQEVETAVREDLAVCFVVLCDRQWGMVKLTQQVGLGPLREVLGVDTEGTINADLGEVRYDEVARAMGAHGERVATPADLEPALRRALGSGRPAVVHVDVDPSKHLFAPGLLDFKEMHQEPVE